MSEEAAPQAHVRTPEMDEVLRRIGRNVMIFQQVEHLLKYLNTHTAFRGPASGLSAHLEKDAASIQKKTMGDLAGKLVDNVLKLPTDAEHPVEVDEIWLSFRFSIETDAEFVDRHDQEMRALVDARNELIHHFLPRWQSAIDGDAGSALAYLDAQREEAVRMKERLEGWALSMEAGRKRLPSSGYLPRGNARLSGTSC